MHINKTLPPVGVRILVKQGDKWVSVLRASWITRYDNTVEFTDTVSNNKININRSDIRWIHP